MKRVFFFVCCFFAIFVFWYYMMDSTSKSDQFSNKTIAKVAKILKQKYGLIPSGFGGGADKGIWVLSLSAHYNGTPLTKEDARKFIVSCANDFLKVINEDENLKPYLKVYPFTPKNIDLFIACFNEKGENVFDPYVASVVSSEGEIWYVTKDPKDPFRSILDEREDFEMAVEILKKKSRNTEI